MTHEPDIGWELLLARAAATCDDDLESFVRGAWSAYVKARPGMREYLEELQLREQLDRMREAGQIAKA